MQFASNFKRRQEEINHLEVSWFSSGLALENATFAFLLLCFAFLYYSKITEK